MAFRPDELRGFHGRWSKGRDRSEDHHAATRAASAFHPRTSESSARRRKAALTGKVRNVNAAYARRESASSGGPALSFKDKEATEYQSPALRSKAIRETGSPEKPKGEQIRSTVKFERANRRHEAGTLFGRVGVKTTFTGKKKVIRGHEETDLTGIRATGHGHGFRRQQLGAAKPKTSARSLMSKPPATTPPAHPQYTRKSLSLKSDAWMREQLTARGVAIPKGARTKVLVNLLASD